MHIYFVQNTPLCVVFQPNLAKHVLLFIFWLFYTACGLNLSPESLADETGSSEQESQFQQNQEGKARIIFLFKTVLVQTCDEHASYRCVQFVDVCDMGEERKNAFSLF